MCVICRREDISQRTTLYCNGCTTLTYIPDLPEGLIELECRKCPNLRTLPTLPPNLRRLDCSKCPLLRDIPSLPQALTVFCCRYSNLMSLPNLPPALTSLHCEHSPNLMGLPNLPQALTGLYCYNCPNLISLGDLPPTLTNLICFGCSNLISLGDLPEGLLVLEYSFCPKIAPFTHVPARLNIFACENNPLIKSLPPFPLTTLIELHCSGCRMLISLPPLPDEGILFDLDCTRCPWLNHAQNPDFSKNLSTLIPLQKQIKKKTYKRYLVARYYLKKKFCNDIATFILSF